MCVTNEREENVFKQHNYLEKMLYSNMKLHVSAYNVTLRCAIPVVCVTNEREESVVKQHN